MKILTQTPWTFKTPTDHWSHPYCFTLRARVPEFLEDSLYWIRDLTEQLTAANTVRQSMGGVFGLGWKGVVSCHFSKVGGWVS